MAVGDPSGTKFNSIAKESNRYNIAVRTILCALYFQLHAINNPRIVKRP